MENELLAAIRARIIDPTLRIDIKTIRVPDLFKPVTAEMLDKTESDIGFKLPSLLRRAYSEVGNGGFGPGAGLVGVDGGYVDVDGRSLSASYLAFRKQAWPEGVLPICDFGDGAWTCINGDDPDGRILTMDHTGVTRTKFTLLTWLAAWVSNVDLVQEMFEINDGVIINPFTKKNVHTKRRGPAKGVKLVTGPGSGH